MRVLVTGCAGFIGWNLVHYILLATDWDVVGVDNLQGGSDNEWAVNDLVRETYRFEYRYENFANTCCENIDIIFHLGATPQVPLSVKNPKLTNENNVTNTLSLMENARLEGVKKIIFSSSSAVYGDQAPTPTYESVICSPMSPYGLQKKIIEDYLILYKELYDLDFCILRYFNAYGPYQYSHNAYAGVVASWVKGVVEDKPIRIDGDGLQTRDFVYVKDICKVNILAVEKNISRIVNVASGMELKLNEVLELIYCSTPNQPQIIRAENRKGDIRKSVADISLLKSYGYKPTEFITGIEETIKWYSNLKTKQNGNSI
tara:strand:- start:1422 stop:2369 length:948 start_codon:yes stop_codon:yes gene_type:complete